MPRSRNLTPTLSRKNALLFWFCQLFPQIIINKAAPNSKQLIVWEIIFFHIYYLCRIICLYCTYLEVFVIWWYVLFRRFFIAEELIVSAKRKKLRKNNRQKLAFSNFPRPNNVFYLALFTTLLYYYYTAVFSVYDVFFVIVPKVSTNESGCSIFWKSKKLFSYKQFSQYYFSACDIFLQNCKSSATFFSYLGKKTFTTMVYYFGK